MPADTAKRPAAPHNQFLDLVRTVAIIRVLAWHAYGYAWISYFVASMPAMFFVAGSLMAHSLERAPVRRVLHSRFRRLLIPTWAFGLVIIPGMIMHSATQTELGRPFRWEQLPAWIFPFWDPQGSDWGITFWTMLWYMRALTWLLLLSPVLLWLYKRISIALIGVPLGMLIVFEFLAREGDPVRWQFQDLALFGIFWLLGFAYNAGVFARLSTPARAGITVIFAAGAAAWVTTQDVPGMVVNASYPAHLLVGLTWLFGALTFERALGEFASRGIPARFVGWVNDRIFTIYLWHAVGLYVMYELLWTGDRPAWLRNLAGFPIVLLVTFVCMLAFGWIEDIAARREMHLTPRSGRPALERPAPGWSRFAMPAAASVGVLAIMTSFLTEQFREEPALGMEAMAVPPSGAGIAIRAAAAEVAEVPPTPAPTPTPGVPLPPVTGTDLQKLIDTWLAANSVSGVTVGIERGDGSRWAGASGIDIQTGQALAVDRVYPTASVTKTFTAALILQLVEEGKVDLDAKVSKYVPGIAHSGDYTVRYLIQHRSGLMATDAVAPADALLAATRTPLAFVPGEGFLYSSPGYYMLGLIIEKVTGVSYTDALHERLLDPLGLTATKMDEEINPLSYSTHPQSNSSLRSSSGVLRSSGVGVTGIRFDYFGVLWSSAGLYSTVADIAAWGIDLYDTEKVVSQATRDQMTTFLGPEFQYAGLATYPFCPCWKEDGKIFGDRWGHYGRSGVLEYDPDDRLSLAIYTSGTDIDERLIVAYDDLSKQIRDLLRNRTLAP